MPDYNIWQCRTSPSIQDGKRAADTHMEHDRDRYKIMQGRGMHQLALAHRLPNISDLKEGEGSEQMHRRAEYGYHVPSGDKISFPSP
jgi:hypothetical protein